MNYAEINKVDIANGPGCRVSVFVQGCDFHCKNCFNQNAWDFNGGVVFNDNTIQKILSLCKYEYIDGLSILGGEPLHPKNIDGTLQLMKAFKERFPNKNIWLWTGFKYEDITRKEIFNYIDVLVDGQYVDELRDLTLKFRGSSNQRIINIPETIKQNKIILLDENM